MLHVGFRNWPGRDVGRVCNNSKMEASLHELLSECWMFYAVLEARVIFTAKTSLDVFSLRREQVLTFSVLGDRIHEMRCLFAHMLTHPVTLY